MLMNQPEGKTWRCTDLWGGMMKYYFTLDRLPIAQRKYRLPSVQQ